MASKSIRLIQLNLDRLEKEMTESLGGRSGTFYAPHAKEAAALAKALATILAEARKLEDRDAKRVANMTFAEKVELWAQWFAELPQEHQKDVVLRMSRLLDGDTDADFE